jgi:hypothetical protein
MTARLDRKARPALKVRPVPKETREIPATAGLLALMVRPVPPVQLDNRALRATREIPEQQGQLEPKVFKALPALTARFPGRLVRRERRARRARLDQRGPLGLKGLRVHKA